MGFNYGLEKKNFDRQWAMLRNQYEDAGMAKVPFLHFDPINAFELPDWFQVKAFVPDLLCFLFGHCVNGINDLSALVVLSFMKQLRFRDFSGLC